VNWTFSVNSLDDGMAVHVYTCVVIVYAVGGPRSMVTATAPACNTKEWQRNEEQLGWKIKHDGRV